MSVITSSPENILTDLNQILEPIQEDMRVLNQVIGKRLASEVTLINQISQYLVQAGGKRIRPA
ncbi:MAG: octaprenyl diphosphate synthase, partial [Burkholderiales bacterium]|nr:octaprenyl diphosphate synthase [Burkholderiales bacterium]